jgi:hypothetical protein
VKIKVILSFLILFITTSNAYAAMGDNGYDGGISSGYIPMQRDTYDYKEVVFVTGKPIVFQGKLDITKRIRDDNETFTYNYTLTHGSEDRLTRRFIVETEIEENSGQIIKTSSLKSNPNESIIIGEETYTLDTNSNVDFSLGLIIDDRAFCDFFAGNYDYKKTYISDNKKVTVSTNGQTYGYEQKWSSTETQELNIMIEGLTISEDGEEDEWNGYVNIKIASTMSNKLLYVENKPNEISFSGGYLQRQENNSILSYSARLPVFDSSGESTDRSKTYEEDINIESFPSQKRLVVPELKKIEGHWCEDDVVQLYSLGIYNMTEEPANEFEPNMYMTRSEFAKALTLMGDLLPEESNTTANINPRLLANNNDENNQSVVESFEDINEKHPFYKYIKAVAESKVMQGTQPGRFEPDRIITRAQAVTTFIRALGLESIAPNPTAVTYFRDNDEIPDWARNSVMVASYIGIVKGDDYGYFNPNRPMTKAESSAMLNRLIDYMRYNIIKDYKNRVFTY